MIQYLMAQDEPKMSSTSENKKNEHAAAEAAAPRSAFATRVAVIEDEEEESSSDEVETTDTDQFDFNSLELTVFNAVQGHPNPVNNNVFHKPTSGSTTLRLKMGEQLVILGEYRLRVLRGLVKIYGALVAPQSGTITVHAPLTHGLPVILCHLSGGCDIDISQVTTDSMRPLGDVSPHFNGIWNCQSSHSDWYHNPSFRILWEQSDDAQNRKILPLLQEPTWDAATADIASSTLKSTRVLVTGPSGSGKSTFAKILANSLMSRKHSPAHQPWPYGKEKYFWLDLDPRHPEFTPQGQISLVEIDGLMLSPSYTYSPRPSCSVTYTILRSHPFASGSLEEPERFLAAAKNLIDLYEYISSNMPNKSFLIINGFIWTPGDTIDLMEQLMPVISAAAVIYLKSRIGAPHKLMQEMYTRIGTAIGNAVWYELTSMHRNRFMIRSAEDLRQMHTMAYFHQDNQPWTVSWWHLGPLSAENCVGLGWGLEIDDTSSILGVIPASPGQTLASMTTILPGAIVTIIKIEDDSLADAISAMMTRGVDPSARPTPLLVMPSGAMSNWWIPDPTTTTVLGQGLIQRLQLEESSLLLQTPIEVGVAIEDAGVTAGGVSRVFLRWGGVERADWALWEWTRWDEARSQEPGEPVDEAEIPEEFRVSGLVEGYADGLGPGSEMERGDFPYVVGVGSQGVGKSRRRRRIGTRS